jgi:hypothetical protein
MNTKAPPEPPGGALFQLNTSSPIMTRPSSTDATDNNRDSSTGLGVHGGDGVAGLQT